MKKLIATAAMLAMSASAMALEVSGVKLDDKVNVGGADLVLNGAGVRSKFGLAKVYVAGLYVPAKAGSADSIISAKQPRRVIGIVELVRRGLINRHRACFGGRVNALSAVDCQRVEVIVRFLIVSHK